MARAIATGTTVPAPMIAAMIVTASASVTVGPTVIQTSALVIAADLHVGVAGIGADATAVVMV